MPQNRIKVKLSLSQIDIWFWLSFDLVNELITIIDLKIESNKYYIAFK